MPLLRRQLTFVELYIDSTDTANIRKKKKLSTEGENNFLFSENAEKLMEEEEGGNKEDCPP